MKIPKHIDPCPVIEALVEIRFVPSMPEDAIFGTIYGAIKEQFPNVEKLPVLQLPDFVREQDPNLKYNPHYRLRNESMIFQSGPRVLTFSKPKPYPGWKAYSEHFFPIINQICKLEITKNVERIGVRFINSFAENIMPHLNLTLNLGDSRLIDEGIMLSVEESIGSINRALRIGNKVDVTIDGVQTTGISVIDIDTSTITHEGTPKPEEIIKTIEQCHDAGKMKFFELLTPSFIASLNPTY